MEDVSKVFERSEGERREYIEGRIKAVEATSADVRQSIESQLAERISGMDSKLQATANL